MNRIQSESYRMQNYEINKTYLSCFDNKAFIVDKGIHALALGHQS